MAFKHPVPQEQPQLVGEGITRTTDPRAKLWPVTITFTTAMSPLRETIRARGPLQAERFARARHLNVRTVAVGPRPVAFPP